MSKELEPRREYFRKKRMHKERHRHKRSIVLFGLFGVADVLLVTLALWTEQLFFLAVRFGLAVWVTRLAQPVSRQEPWTSRQALISLTAILLPFGGVMAAMWSLRFTNPNGSWLDLPAAPEESRPQIDWQNLLDVVPLIDVLESEDTAYKKSVLLKAQTMRSSVQVSVVRQALEDEDPEVRYYAASLLAHTEAAHSNRIRRLEQEIEQSPNDPHLWNGLADAYEQIIAAGIAGDELSRFYLEKRECALERSLRLDPEQPVTGIAQARTLLALGRNRDAESAARRWLDQDLYSDQARAVLISIAYVENDQYFLEAVAHEIQDVSQLPSDVRGVVELLREQEVAL